jgi:hypothetical protein
MYISKKVMRNLFSFLVVFSLILVLFFSFMATPPDCNALKTGRFHSYTKKGDHIQITRIDGIQQDVNTQTKDTTYWKIEWLGNCRFAASYLSGAGPKNEAEKRLYENTILYFDIKEIADDYYIGTTTVKASNGMSVFTDTTWLVARK